MEDCLTECIRTVHISALFNQPLNKVQIQHFIRASGLAQFSKVLNESTVAGWSAVLFTSPCVALMNVIQTLAILSRRVVVISGYAAEDSKRLVITYRQLRQINVAHSRENKLNW